MGYNKPTSRRINQVATLISRGLNDKAIATELGLELGTVKIYVRRLYDKLDITSKHNNRAYAALVAERYIGCISS